MLLQFEKELAQAVEALTKEQEKAAQAEKEKQTQVTLFTNSVRECCLKSKTYSKKSFDFGLKFQLKEQKEERSKLLECLSKEKETVSQIEEQRDKVIKEKEEMEKKNAMADQALEKVRKQFDFRNITSQNWTGIIRVGVLIRDS